MSAPVETEKQAVADTQKDGWGVATPLFTDLAARVQTT